MALDVTVRRRWFGALVVAVALAMLVAGQTILCGRLKPVEFVVYWLVCLVLTGLAIVAAFRDLRPSSASTSRSNATSSMPRWSASPTNARPNHNGRAAPVRARRLPGSVAAFASVSLLNFCGRFALLFLQPTSMKCAGASVNVPEESVREAAGCLVEPPGGRGPGGLPGDSAENPLVGPSVAAWLRPHTLSREPALRRRAQRSCATWTGRPPTTHSWGSRLKHGVDFDLETGAWLLAQTQYPDINPEAYRALLDSYAAELRERLDPAGEAKQTLGAFNHYLFSDLGFTGNEADHYDPENS